MLRPDGHQQYLHLKKLKELMRDKPAPKLIIKKVDDGDKRPVSPRTHLR